MKKHIFTMLLLFMSVVGSSQSGTVTVKLTGGANDQALQKKIESNASQFLSRINRAYLNKGSTPAFNFSGITENGQESVTSLWRENNFYCAEEKVTGLLLNRAGNYQLRNLPFMIGNNEIMYGVIEFLPDGRIEDFLFGLNEHQYTSILNSRDVTDQTRRDLILNFVEILRTAYVKKDLDYISKLYSDKALIITGKVIKDQVRSNEGIMSGLTNKQVEYQVLTKVEYIRRLSEVFKNISYLKLDFDNIKVEQHRKFPDFYGVTLKQTWITSNYKDLGLLFLFVQFRENEDFVIWVRTWQDAAHTPDKDAFGMHNFTIQQGSVMN